LTLEELDETILPCRAGQRVGHDGWSDVPEGGPARLLELRVCKKSSIAKTLSLSVAAIPDRFALPVITTTPTIFGSGEVLLSGRDFSLICEKTQNVLDVAMDLGDRG